MEPIKHTHIEVRVKLHVAEIGTGTQVVLFLHGFPEIWYTWRYQMIAVGNAGYRAIAIDFSGYGLSDEPSEIVEKGTFLDLVDDIIDLLDTLDIDKVFLVGKDFGALAANLIAVLHPKRLSALVTLGIPFMLPGPNVVQSDIMPEGFYFTRWQEPGRAEADISRLGVKTVIRNIYTLFSKAEVPIAGDNQEIMDLVDSSTPLPSWFSEEDLAVYASLYGKSGFRFPLQVPYSYLLESAKLDYGVTDPKVICPALLIMGKKDYVLKLLGMEEYIGSGQAKHFIPDVEIIYVEEGSHFIPEQLPENVNDLLINFLNKHNS